MAATPITITFAIVERFFCIEGDRENRRYIGNLMGDVRFDTYDDAYNAGVRHLGENAGAVFCIEKRFVRIDAYDNDGVMSNVVV